MLHSFYVLKILYGLLLILDARPLLFYFIILFLNRARLPRCDASHTNITYITWRKIALCKRNCSEELE